jgi:hypothetical protein
MKKPLRHRSQRPLNKNYIKHSHKKSKKSVGEHSFGNIQVIIKDYFTNDIDLDMVLDDVAAKIPHEFLELIDYIIIGQFKELESRSVNAAYMDGAIYATNDQTNEEDLIDDIIHEVAHAVEEKHFMEIYSDKYIEREFLGKRERLYHLLEQEKIEMNYQDFLEPEYSADFDNFLYFEVGYPLLSAVSVNLFYSPYAITSLREYFANGFEAYFNNKDRNRVHVLSPILFDKLEKLDYNKERKR